MNKWMGTGRLTRDPDVRYSAGDNSLCVARFTLAVNRRGKDAGADFISCVAFGKQGEFVEKYFHKGMKADLSGHIQTGSYQNKDGQTVYTTDVVVEDIEFGESKNANTSAGIENGTLVDSDGFENVPADELGLPFNDIDV